MTRRNYKPVLKFRYRRKGKVFGAVLSQSESTKNKLKGRLLSVRKVSREQILGIGEYLPFDPDKLVEELRKGGL